MFWDNNLDKNYYKNKVIAVVVTYNRKELLRQCIERLISQENESCDVLIVDNASNDGTPEMIQRDFSRKEVIYYNTGANLGGAGGFEIGVKKAVEMGYSYMWIMDDDTLPEKDALLQLMKADQKLDGNYGFLSSVAYWTDGNICSMNIQKKNIFKHINNSDYKKDIVPIKMCSFVSLLVKAEWIKKLGCPIGEYFIWTDDYEFTGRISRNAPCYMIPKSKVIHAMKKHTRVNFATDDSSRMERYRYIYRNDVHCYRQYGINGWIYIMLKDIYTAVNIILHSSDNKIKKIRILKNGFIEGLHFNPKIVYPNDVISD
ncbi:MAG: glycosyltransferase family 2 protein [Clostridiales bacterium]|nr:glycosyltransferase family 2 protein [Clostridiales bacterium]